MKRTFTATLFAMGLVAFAVPGIARADDDEDDDESTGPDREIARIVNRVEAERIQETVERLEAFGTRNSCSDTQAPGRGVTPARDFIAKRFGQIKGLKVALDPFVHGNCPNTPTFNVLAWLPGTTHPERLVIIGGHYDSRTIGVLDTVSDAPGANDSGSQSAVVLELAKVLSHERHPDTIVFVTFSGEEQGLFGSGSIAARIASASKAGLPSFFQGSQAVAMLNNDIVGGDNFVNGPGELQKFRLYSGGTPREIGSRAPDGSTDNTSPSRGLMRYVATWGVPYVSGFGMIAKMRQDRPGRSSDQRSFTDNAIPAVRFMETVECSPSPIDNAGCTVAANGLCTVANASPLSSLAATDPRRGCLLGFNAGEPTSGNIAHQHSPEDRSTFVTAEYSARIAKVMAATAATLARAPLAPSFPRDAAGVPVAPTVDATGAVTLTWSATAGDAIDHFVIAARATTENFYRQRVTAAGGATSRAVTPAELGLGAGEAFLISVAAVDAKGHESLFAYPEFRCEGSSCRVPAGALNVTAAR
jgi:Peptidase family M28